MSVLNLNIKGSGGHEVNLRAPTSGDLAGILIWHTGNNQSLFLNYGNALTGSLLKPAGAVRMDGVYYVPNGTLTVQKEGGGL
ncbi:hypothetical protein, partial [Orrella sp. 11846]|uniref:hypothetical protein n=1 Tax=Orrella sp. 11846 TaxID=3409913 RepID=UPI003B5B54F4